MYKLLLVYLLLFTISANASITDPKKNADKTGTISGKVLDAKLNQPLPYVNIIIKNTKGETLTGGISLDDGTFKIEKVTEGDILVSIQYIGYKTFNKKVNIGKGNYRVNLGHIFLEESTEDLDEITIIAEVSTIQQKVDRKIINVGKDLAALGTASELITAVPSVNVDAQTGDISLRGNQNVRVMVDGKFSNIPTAQLLRQIPSTSIKQVELITNPSAKYNPEGMSGIINIVLHKNTMIGFNGGFDIGIKNQREAKFNSSINLNYRNGKFNIYGNYGNNIQKRQNNGLISQIANNSFQTISIFDNNKSHLYKVGVDFYLNDKNTISVFTNQNIFDGKNMSTSNFIFNENMLNNQNQINDGLRENSSSQYNFDYKLDFDKKGHHIELEIDYNIFDNTIETDNILSGLNIRPSYLELTNTDRNNTTINLDYINPISDKAKLELGLQARLFDNEIIYESDGSVRNQSGDYISTITDFDYKRNIFSAYANFSKKFEKWTYQLGLRGESVHVDAIANETDLTNNLDTTIPFNNDYFQVYPSVFFTYSPSEKNSYQLSYSRRVDRPGIRQVNPIPQWNTPLISDFGNHELEPQFTNSIEVNYTRNLEKGNITGGVFYRIIEDEINRAVYVDRSDLASNRIILTHDNFENTSAYGFELSSNYKPTKWWSLNTSFDLYSQTQKGIAERIDPTLINPTENDIISENVEVDNVIWNFRIFNNFKASKKLTFTAFAMYRGQESGLNFEVDPMYFVNLGARYSFLENNKATFSLSFNDVFDTQKINVVSERPFLQTAEFSPEFRTVSANLSYRFGDGKYRAKSRKHRDNNEKSGGGF
ncbi:outer membrane beta-barrel family protein [Flavivirga jejuensis]|uniref:Outer membrane beta-barrel family protein n=1 Tax=Flavivirga jejuensis TaxID=870487 RepID=A0ABT8WW29_9FLAO|nr:outer membrane beta-barrel family protein [Flavivirga jejuensis]MDO5977199.1 outer membrane beta-barrel family protein [Flavivirga jejuensis]